MRKLFIYLLLLLSFSSVHAKKNTLGGLKRELAGLRAKHQQNEANKTQTRNELNQTKNNIFKSQDEISKNQKAIDKAKIEIEKTNIDISKTEEKVKKLMKAFQQSKGENIYLEYISKARNYHDLIYRYAMVEQLATYSNKQLEEYQGKIKYNNQLQKELAEREKELEKQIKQLEINVGKLGNRLSEYSEITMDLQDEIKSTQELVNYIQGLGCRDDQDIDQCMRIKGDTRFSRPVTTGTITSPFGYRRHPVTGAVQSFHNAIDISGPNYTGTRVYSSANGRVGKIIRRASCGGNQVFVYHNISGRLYTTAYLHLQTINVSVGDTVTSNTVVGTVGGHRSTTPWDYCSTGAHLHFVIANGWYGTSCAGDCYLSYNTYLAKSQDPAQILGLPARGVYWYSR